MNPQEKQGHVGNLSNKTMDELKELLIRQENILKNGKLIESLPDKGRKVRGFRDNLVKLIQERTPIKPQKYDQSAGISQSSVDRMEWQKPTSKFSKKPVTDQRKANTKKRTELTSTCEPVTKRDIVHLDSPDLCNQGIDTMETDKIPETVQNKVTCMACDENVKSAENEINQKSVNQFSALRDKQTIEFLEKDHEPVELKKDRLQENESNMKSRNTDSEGGNSKSLLPSNIHTDEADVDQVERKRQQDGNRNSEYLSNRLGDNSDKHKSIDVPDLQDSFTNMRLNEFDMKNEDPDQLKQKIVTMSSEVRSCFKPNSFLKITKVQDLPNKYKFKSKEKSLANRDTEMVDVTSDSSDQHTADATGSLAPDTVGGHVVSEESAATPPVYQYNQTRLISVTDSLALLQQQQARQEKLQAQTAAARLAQRLNIKMESYNPEGVDMSYRDREDEADFDSDDDEGEITGYMDE